MIFVAVCCRGSRELRSSAWRSIRIRGWSISMEHEILGYFSDNGSVGWGARGAPRGLVSRTGVGHWDSSDVARRREVERYRDGHSTLGDHTTRTRRRGPSALTLRRHERGPVRAGRSVRRVTLKSESEVFRVSCDVCAAERVRIRYIPKPFLKRQTHAGKQGLLP